MTLSKQETARIVERGMLLAGKIQHNGEPRCPRNDMQWHFLHQCWLFRDDVARAIESGLVTADDLLVDARATTVIPSPR